MGEAEEILPVMELMDAIYRSADQGKEVKLG
jgi:predicted dehydrogenase